MKQLDIILRTCDRGPVHPERGERYIDADKATLIKKCLISLLQSVDLAKDLADIKLYIVDDNSSKETLDYIKMAVESFNIPYTVEVCKEMGYNYSALRQFELCRDVGRELVYSVEDDYLHFPEAICQMIKMSEKFSGITGSTVAIRPDDDLFTYTLNNPHSKKSCIVLLGEDRHWRTLYNTHNTLFTHVNVFKEYWELFASLAKFFKHTSINEDKTINMIWEGLVPLFSPIPTLALHVSQGNTPPFVNYQKLWDSIKI